MPERSPSASIVGPAIEKIARDRIADLIGFWVIWHLYGGFEGLERHGYHRATIYRKISRFRQDFGAHPDDYEFPGLTVDLNKYWKAAREATEASTQ